jgi:membrane associated rhomboid family serine protease
MSLPSVPRQAQRTPIFNLPTAIVGIVVVLCAIHAGRLLLSEESDLNLLRQLAFVPARIAAVLDPQLLARKLGEGVGDAQALDRAAAAHFFLGQGGLKPWTLLTYALLHANFAHLAMNLLWLIAFGAPVARRFGAGRFIAFLCVASIAGAVAHTVAHPFDVMPVIGASAAVSGAVAAAIRFVFQPGESLGPPLPDDAPEAARPAPPLPLAALFRSRQVVSFLLVWFVVNFGFGILAVPLGITEQAIAWEAHIGGFLAGLLLFSLFDPPVGRSGRDGAQASAG